jgi:hypothetical protein
MQEKYIYIASFFILLGIVLSHTYRLYIYENQIFDFHIADTIGNLVAVPTATCLGLAIYPKLKLIQIVCLSVFSYILYEMMGLIHLLGTFDIYDIIATLISGLITFIILNKIQAKKNKKSDM